MEYLSTDHAKMYILLNFSFFYLFCLFDLSIFQKTQMYHSKECVVYLWSILKNQMCNFLEEITGAFSHLTQCEVNGKKGNCSLAVYSNVIFYSSLHLILYYKLYLNLHYGVCLILYSKCALFKHSVFCTIFFIKYQNTKI